MSYQLTARAAITIEANRAAVWRALCDPETLRRHIFATSVDYPEYSNWLEREPTFEWRDGGTITWGSDPRKGIQHGTILKIDPENALHFNHPFPGCSYGGLRATVTINLAGDGETTEVSITDDSCGSVQRLEANRLRWRAALATLKDRLEGRTK